MSAAPPPKSPRGTAATARRAARWTISACGLPTGWETYDPFVDTGITMAKQHLDGGGTADPDEDLVTQFGFPLGDWFAYVRELRRDGQLDPSDAALIEALPRWHW